MTTVFSGRVLCLLLALGVGWIPTAPPEHVHESEDHGHEHVVVHRHFDGHHTQSHAAHHDNSVNDDDAAVVMLEAVYGMPSAAFAGLSYQVPPAVVLAVPPVPVHSPTPDYVERLIHGPPRAPTGLRAPPVLTRL
jgi:hypothetical protein